MIRPRNIVIVIYDRKAFIRLATEIGTYNASAVINYAGVAIIQTTVLNKDKIEIIF